jgi:predicted SAM-dependent methyltransferase
MKFRINRNIFDYYRVQLWVGDLIRNSRLFIRKQRIKHLKYLDIGCGPIMHKDFVNLDYKWIPGLDVCWNITKFKLPFPDNRFEGVFSEHTLEHIKLPETENLLLEIKRILKPGGTVRIILPDGELYIDIYIRKRNGEDVRMPYIEDFSPMARINGIFRNNDHQFIFDFLTLKKVLENAGFKNIVKCSFQNGKNPDLFIDSEVRVVESFYVEAEK